MEGDDCTEDYIIIPDNGKNNNRYCGMALSDINSKLEVILQLRKHHFDLFFQLVQSNYAKCEKNSVL